MSLSLDEFVEARMAWEKMDERLNRLIGFNPATSNHYGIIKLYNIRIDAQTPDEEIINIRSAFLKWENNIITILSEYNLIFDEEKINKLFSVDGMFGTLTFLGFEVDIYQKTDVYRELVGKLLHDESPINQFQQPYRNILKGLKR